jgi:PEP-CTERM motif
MNVKSLLNFFVVAGLVACLSGIASANLLTNGNMDSSSLTSQFLPTPTGYVAISNQVSVPPDGLSSESFPNIAGAVGDCGGGGCGVFYKMFSGSAASTLDSSLHQDNPATPGLQYKLTGWIAANVGYTGRVGGLGTTTEFGIEFLDGGGGVIGGDILSLGPAELNVGSGSFPFGDPGGVSYYKQYTTMALAPAGTVSVRSRLSVIDGYQTGPGALVTDLWDLTVVPEPSGIVLAGLALTGALFRRRTI